MASASTHEKDVESGGMPHQASNVLASTVGPQNSPETPSVPDLQAVSMWNWNQV
jgi:hypothetical protein